MYSLRPSDVLRKLWIKRQLTKLHRRYEAKFREVEAKHKTQVHSLWKAHRRTQLDDLVVCIDFRLHFLRPLLSNDLVENISRHKKRFSRRQNLPHLIILADIICLSNVEHLEIELKRLFETQKGRWLSWKK
jgi:hypothetical protein